MEKKFYNNITDVEGLGTSNILYSKEFLSYVEIENKDSLNPYYFCIYENKKLVSFAPAYIHKKNIGRNFQTYMGGKIEQLLKLTGFKFNKVLSVFIPYRIRSDIIGNDVYIDEMVKFIEKTAQDQKFHGIVYPLLIEDRKVLVENLTSYNKAFFEANYILKTNFDTYEDFLMSLKYKIRKKYRNIENRILNGNLKIKEINNINKHVSTIEKLYLNLMNKYNNSFIEFDKNAFIQLYKYISTTLTIGAFKDNELIGFCTRFHDKNIMHALRYGVDYEKSKDTGIYFYLIFNATVKKSIQLGIKQIDYGSSMYNVKTLRGCNYRLSHIYVKIFNPIHNFLVKYKMDKLHKDYYNTFLEEKKRPE